MKASIITTKVSYSSNGILINSRIILSRVSATKLKLSWGNDKIK